MATGVSLNATPIYAGPPPHQTYPTSTMSSLTPRMPTHHNPPHGLRRSMDLDQDPSPVQAPRQSLPSIHEALRTDNPLPYPGPPSSGPPAHTHAIPRPSTEGPTGPPNPFSPSNTYLRESQYPVPQGPVPAPDPSRVSVVSLSSTQDSRKPSLQSHTGKSPTSSSKTAPTSISTSQGSGAAYEYSTSTSVVASPNSYGSYPSQAYSWQSQPPAAYSYGPWKPNAEVTRNDEKSASLSNRPGMPSTQTPHSDSVKRHFDSYEVESSLAEIIDGSTKTVEFSRHYAALAHQNQRSGPILGTLPSIHELDDLIQLQQRNHDGLMRIRNAVLSQEHALAEQRVQQRHSEAKNGYDDENSGLYQDGFKSPTGSEAKKRRGKAAPPGRCHSCNRAETPEWRRGPDGARTLCNACGLHYAKLTRKMGAGSKATALGSNIKPKGIDSSPAHR